MWTEKKLNDVLTEPTLAMVEDMKRIDGDILVLGAGGKMGHTICVLASKAMERAGIHKKVIAVSRFHDPEVRKYLEENHVEMIQADLQDLKQLENLPEVPNVIYMAGRKFGTDGQEWMTWGVNSVLPAFVGEKYKNQELWYFHPAIFILWCHWHPADVRKRIRWLRWGICPELSCKRAYF